MTRMFAQPVIVWGLAFIVNLSGPFGVRSSLAAADQGLVPLPLKLPQAIPRNTPPDPPKGPNVEPIPDPLKHKKRPDFLAPKGTSNVALGKKVTTSAPKIYTGELPQITDGKKEARDDEVVEFPKGVQWVQLDLGKNYAIYALVLWHDHRQLQVFHSVVVQAAEDAGFTKSVRTLFNNDIENKAKLGVGTDKQYFETEEGKLIDAKGAKARYVRCYSDGCSASSWNVYQEIEVYGLPAE